MLIGFVSLFGTGLIVIPIMLICSPIYQLNPELWYAIGDSLWAPMWGLCILYCETFGGTTFVYQGDEPLEGESVLIMANHLGDLDWVVMLSLAARMRALAGVRFIMKASLAKLPLLGWGLALHHNVFIRSRPSGRPVDGGAGDDLTPRRRLQLVQRDTADVTSTVRSLLTTGTRCQPVWIGLFPEGTRLIPDQHARALAFAEERGKPRYQFLLQPRTKGLEALLAGARPCGLTHALDLTVAYEGFSAECERNSRQSSILDGVVRELCVHVLIRRVALPEEGDDAGMWLQAAWQEKERALARWEHDGSFEAERIESLQTLPLCPQLLSALVGYAAAALLCASISVLAGLALYHRALGSAAA